MTIENQEHIQEPLLPKAFAGDPVPLQTESVHTPVLINRLPSHVQELLMAQTNHIEMVYSSELLSQLDPEK